MRYRDFDHFRGNNKDLFMGHKATIQKMSGNGGRDCIIEFRQPDTNEGAVQITYIGGILSISGDYGYAMFNWHNPKNHLLAFSNFKDIGYVLEKCVAKDDKFEVFDKEVFDNDFKAWQDQLIEDGYDQEIGNIDIPDVEDENDVIEYFKDFHVDEIDSDSLYEYGVYSFGVCISWETYAKWYGLHEAIRQLENEGAL